MQLQLFELLIRHPILSNTRNSKEAVDQNCADPPLNFTEDDFADVDAHASATPTHLTHDVRKLSNHLTAPYHSELDKLRAIFFWVTHNIAYDVDSWRSGNMGAQSADRSLRERKGVCAGYADLFTALATHARLDVRTVSGAARGAGSKPGDPFFESGGHAWNIVHIQGQYKFIDSTWGAGIVSGHTFEFKYTPYYFLTRPSHFIYSHFPSDPADQLLHPSIRDQTFLDLPYVKGGYFTTGMELVSPRNTDLMGCVEADEEGYAQVAVCVDSAMAKSGGEWDVNTTFEFPWTVVAPSPSNGNKVVWRKGREHLRGRLGSWEGGTPLHAMLWVERVAGGKSVVTVRVKCPKAGDGELRIGFWKSSTQDYLNCINFRIHCPHSPPAQPHQTFPTLYTSSCNYNIISPTLHPLSRNSVVRFHLAPIDAPSNRMFKLFGPDKSSTTLKRQSDGSVLADVR
ncbi:hypothetical protein HK104_008648, partial [Borealophlyctis nickersoniae]